MAGIGPLSGYKVLDFTQFESGTVCTETLAWLGAEVWKVERPVKGELGRYSVEEPSVDAVGFVILNMNKESITCNLKDPEGLRLIRKLVEQVDVVVENMGPGSMDKLGLGYEDCKKLNEKIVYAQIKGFGTDGPYAEYPAFNPIAAAVGGMPAVTGQPGEMPVQSGLNIADSGAGYMCALSVIAALLQKEKQGIGQKIEVAMQDVVIGFGRSNWEPYYRTGKPPKRVGNGMPLEDVAPAGMYACKPYGENDYVHIYCSRHPGSKQFENLCNVIGRSDLIEDTRFKTPRSRYLYKDILNPIIEGWTREHTKQDAMDILCRADIPAGAVFDCDDITKDEYLRRRGTMVEIEHSKRGKLVIPGFAPRMSENHVEYRLSPELGSYSEKVFKEYAGLSDEDYEALKAKHII
ncbi:CaiB/BaiF CoA transferase family protein [Youngiibacter multivorans]|uniref:Formyl-CoA transferase n=1 Tax=Youngiibacter multivorans TaxID=937251 RepID=A0ABS4G7B4_9CLOT|nr:CaiB/BaiF CoA-transferase family protein [Youngiibacter multivorans]MBP1920446.1 formyl-CoA transferase [Youngiibacter multivorans]